jgi:hypothetical protein
MTLTRPSRQHLALTYIARGGSHGGIASIEWLVAKRGELAGEAERCRRELHRLADELRHLDVTIRLCVPRTTTSSAFGRGRGVALTTGSGLGNASVWSWKSYGMPRGRCRTKA